MGKSVGMNVFTKIYVHGIFQNKDKEDRKNHKKNTLINTRNVYAKGRKDAIYGIVSQNNRKADRCTIILKKQNYFTKNRGVNFLIVRS